MVIQHIVYFHRTEGAKSHMESHMSNGHTHIFDLF